MPFLSQNVNIFLLVILRSEKKPNQTDDDKEWMKNQIKQMEMN